MNILYYYWQENSAEDLINTLKSLGHHVKKISTPFTDYDKDEQFLGDIYAELKNHHFDCVFTFDFFPLISKAAQEAAVPYISWIYDMPHTTLLSPQCGNPMNYIFIFDFDLYSHICDEYPHAHIYHQSLAVNTTRLTGMVQALSEQTTPRFQLSFVGSLYEKCLYNQINYLPDYYRGYLSGIMSAQQMVYGANIIEPLLKHQYISELKKYIMLDIPSGYHITYKDLLVDMLQAKVTSEERIELLNTVAQNHSLTLFTASDSKLVPKAVLGGIVDYEKEMPVVFHISDINLNITARSITSGIPLRALDIMGARGFLLSNYQPELDAYFQNGEECVMFDSKEDMLAKIEYYLSHGKERQEIAQNGFHRVNEEFSYQIQVARILEKVFE